MWFIGLFVLSSPQLRENVPASLGSGREGRSLWILTQCSETTSLAHCVTAHSGISVEDETPKLFHHNHGERFGLSKSNELMATQATRLHFEFSSMIPSERFNDEMISIQTICFLASVMYTARFCSELVVCGTHFQCRTIH